MELKFRNLKADEIDCRGKEAKDGGGMSVLLYKKARVDQNMLDEHPMIGPLNWKREQSILDNRMFCTVSIRNPETGEWISKQDVGAPSDTDPVKGEVSDAFKRACFNWGIGRELYTAPKMYLSQQELNGNKDFRVAAINYNGSVIKDVTIEVLDRERKVTFTKTFSNDPVSKSEQIVRNAAVPPAKPAPAPAVRVERKAAVPVTRTVPSAPAQPVKAQAAANTAGYLKDDEIILIGNCRGRKYGDVKNDKAFHSSLGWVKAHPDMANSTRYDARQKAQFAVLMRMANEL